MALFRVTTSFNGRKQGWTESFTFQASDNLTAEAFSTTIFQPIGLARKNLLAREYVLDGWRVAKFRLDDGTPLKRNVYTKSIDLAPDLQTVANAGEQPRDCLLLKASGLDGEGIKHTFMRGIPDDILKEGGVYHPDGAGGWGSRFASWNAVMTAGVWGWLEDVVVKGEIEVQGYTINPNATITFQFAEDTFPTLDIGQVVPMRFAGINGKSVLNRRMNVRIETEGVATSIDAIATFPYSHGGIATRYNTVKAFQAGSALSGVEGRTHDTGRPLSATRGRQPAQARG